MNNDIIEVTVVSVHEHKDSIFIGRGKDSPLGNPYFMKDESQRDYVCDRYEDYFNRKLDEEDEVVLNELSRLTMLAIENGYIKLGCFCNTKLDPKRCHGDTIKRFLDSVLNLEGN
jgi:hypothetical protein